MTTEAEETTRLCVTSWLNMKTSASVEFEKLQRDFFGLITSVLSLFDAHREGKEK